jgi:hypothetical protein
VADEDNDAARIVLTRLARLNATVQGLVFGTLLGGVIFVATNWLILKGGEPVGPHLALLGQFFIGYRVTFVGSLIGWGYGFITGFLAGYLMAMLYNSIGARRQERRDKLHHSDT